MPIGRAQVIASDENEEAILMGNKVSAREQVRRARARRDAERKAQEKRVDGFAEDFFKATAQLEQAQQAVEDARGKQGEAIDALLGEGETLASLTEFLGATRNDLKTAQQAHQQGQGQEAAAPPPMKETTASQPASSARERREIAEGDEGDAA